MTYARAYLAARAVMRHHAALQCAREATADRDRPAALQHLADAVDARRMLVRAKGRRA